MEIAGLDSDQFIQEFNVVVLSGAESLVNTGKIPAMEKIDTTVKFKFIDVTASDSIAQNTALAITDTPTNAVQPICQQSIP